VVKAENEGSYFDNQVSVIAVEQLPMSCQVQLATLISQFV